MNVYIDQVVRNLIVCPATDYEDQLFELAEAIADLEDKLSRVTPLERRTSAPLIKAKLEELRQKRETVEMAQRGYPVQFSLEALQLRYIDGENQGLPVFAILDFGQERDFVIHSRRNGLLFSPANLPNEIQAKYSDLQQYMSLVENLELQLSAHWNGVIPDDANQAAQQARKSGLFERMFLIPQITHWTVTTTTINPRPVTGDPFIIGLRQGVYYLIAHFDPTDLEEYVRTHFTIE